MDAAGQSFPSIKELVSQSWSLCKKSILNLFLLNVFMLLVNIFLLIVMGLFGFFILLGGNLDRVNNPNALTALLFSPGVIIYFFIFLLLSFTIGSIYKISPVLFVDKADEGLGFLDIIKKSFAFIIPIILASVMVIFFVLGGYIVFIVPGILFSYFLIFVPYEIILAGKKPWAAIKGSLTIVTSHFGEILIRFLLYTFAFIFLTFFIPRIIVKIEPSTGILIGLTSFITNALFAWFGLSYSITMYHQARSLTDESKQTSTLFMTIVSLLGWAILILLILFGAKNYSSKFGQAFINSFNKSYQKQSISNRPLTLTNVYTMLDDLTIKTYEYRTKNNLPQMEVDQKLCAYAQRRMEQLRNNKGYDDNRGFFEDIANKEIGLAYFSSYSNLNNFAWIPISNTDNSEIIFKTWTTGSFAERDRGIVANPDYTNFCYRGDLESIILVGGKKIN